MTPKKPYEPLTSANAALFAEISRRLGFRNDEAAQ
jgi:hypothetical protein